MSYDLTLFATVPGEDPEDTVGELLESFDEELPAAERPAVAAKVGALVAALARGAAGSFDGCSAAAERFSRSSRPRAPS